MKLLLNVDVVLDVLLERQPYAEPAAGLWTLVERGQAEGFLAAHGLAAIHQLAARHRDTKYARQVLQDLVTVFQVAAVDWAVTRRALALAWRDFDNAVCAAAAEACGCDAIVTRSPEDFPTSSVRAIDPATALAWIVARKTSQSALA